MEPRYLVAVHAGAGYHSTKHEVLYRAGLVSSCRAAAEALVAGSSALDAVAAAITSLEDCGVCNAGRGSNLTFGGSVECDASVMGGDGSFGAVGAVPGVANPVQIAHTLAQELSQPLAHGRVRPMMLVGDQARVWALSRGIPAAQTAEEAAECNLTEAARRRWRRYRAIVDGKDGGGGSNSAGGQPAGAAEQGKGRAPIAGAAEAAAVGAPPDSRLAAPLPDAPRAKRPRRGDGTAGQGRGGSEESLQYDTVGCVVVDRQGRVAAGVSSGGIALKTEGRVGEAAVFGAGCWAQDGRGDRPATACSVSGVGEHIMRHLVARECAGRASLLGAEQDGGTAARACAAVLRETILQGPPPRDCGVLCIRAVADPAQQAGSSGQDLQEEGGGAGQLAVQVELGVAHCAHSMAVGYLTHAMSHPHVTFLRRGEPAGGSGTGGRGRQGRPQPAGDGSEEAEAALKELTFGVHWRA